MLVQVESEAVLWSSFIGTPAATFKGYCFVGNDFVKSASGLHEYTRATGNPIRSGEDGCYVTAFRNGASATIGSDASGFHRLFYYSEGNVWCVSDSVFDMAHHLVEHGVQLTPDIPQLTGFSSQITLGKQLSSFHTPFREIRLVPSFCDVRIDQGVLSIQPRAREGGQPYAEVLHSFVNTWVSRFETLLSDDRLQVTPDISGGTDSRAILALWIAATKRCGRELGDLSFLSSQGPRWKADYEIATLLGRSYGFSLGRKPSDVADVYMTPMESFEKWAQVCLGVYRPIYIPTVKPSVTTIRVHGGGGENFRDFYNTGVYEALLEGNLSGVPETDHGRQWIGDILSAIDELKDRDASVDPMVAHYREFRGRIHSGRGPLYQTNLAPFVSKTLERLDMKDTELIGAQVNFDIMESLVPGLREFPYDKHAKAPQPRHRERTTLVDLEPGARPGRAYIGDEQAGGGKDHFDRSAWMGLLTEQLRRSDRAPVVEIVGCDIADDAKAVMEEARNRGRFSHATKAMNITTMVTANLALESAGY